VEARLYNLVLHTTERGDSPIDEFLDGLDKKSRAKVAAYLSLLEEEGPNLKRPYADVVRGKIRELRIHYSSNQYRVLYFFHVHDQIVLLHAFSKKSQQLKEKDIAFSERRMEDWMRRFPSGGGL
jgi:phage-related protein